ncbi:MAG: MGH1-like glycoside hydrolase domain-containing protein, partial [Anaerolineales bacterium]
MISLESTPYLSLLRNQIDITRVPFSDRGSRLLVYQHVNSTKFYIKLAERILGLESDLEAYLQRKPFIDNLTLIDEDENELDLSLVTSPQSLNIQTNIGEFGIVFQDLRTISIGIPENQTTGLRFHVRPMVWHNTDNGGELKSIRNLGYSTNGEIIKNQILPQNGTYQVELVVKAGLDSAITLHVNPTLDVLHETLPFSMSYDRAYQRWRNWFSRIPSVEEPYRKTYAYAWWIMANNLISPLGNVAFEAMTPSKTSYIGLWLWDSALHALAYRYIDPELARNQIRAMLAYQLPDGMIPDAIYDDGVVAEIDHPFPAEVTKPPILAWAALKLHEIAPDLEFLQEIYVPLVRWNAWWFSMNDDDVDGLVQYNHPYSSGLDDNPMWDFGFPVESPDLNTYLCVQMGSLAMIAEALG